MPGVKRLHQESDNSGKAPYIFGHHHGVIGLMAGCAIGELATLHATGGPLPDYAPAFSLERYEDPAYREEIATLADVGQL